VSPVADQPEYVDSHCHVAGAEFDADREEVLARARAVGVVTLLVVGVIDAEGNQARALELAAARGFPCAVGVHPHDARRAGPDAFDEIAALASAGRIVAVGEAGLDFHYDLSPREVQADVFRRQIRLARDLGLPIIVHSREAEAQTATILETERAGEVGGVIHCYAGGAELARRALALGFSISFSGIVAFPKAEELRQVARRVPEGRLLIETDAPYLAPPPHRGTRNEPAFVVDVAAALARARGEPLAALARRTAENFRRLFRI
jgi:TatD DNase family protein